MQIITKITPKTVLGDVLKKGHDNGMLFRLAATVTNIETVSTQYGESLKFRGEFIARRFSDGEEFYAGTAFLPRVAESLVAGSFTGEPLQVVLDVGTRKAETQTGYEFTVKPVRQVENPLRALLDLGDGE